MKDNKIDIMCRKIGDMIMALNHGDGPISNTNVSKVTNGLIVLQQDLEILRKCTLDNPDFKWSDNQSK